MSTKSVTLYGIKNCDSVKKARKYLENLDINYSFHDFRVDGLEQKKLVSWVGVLGWKKVLNTRSTSWRQLPDEQKESITETSALTLMLENPTLIKRPVTEIDDKLLVGFKEAEYQGYF